MVTGVLDIVNLALSRLGESPIASMDEASPAAVTARAQYDPARRAALRSYNWTFSLRRKKLNRLLAPVEGHYQYTFQLPADCLRPLRLVSPIEGTPPDTGGTVGFEPVGDGRICCDEEDPLLEYVADVTDPTKFDDLFVESLSYRLASGMAMPITGDPAQWQNLLQAARQFEREAAAQSGRERRDPGGGNIYVEARQ